MRGTAASIPAEHAPSGDRRRTGRATWFDPRFAIGIILVVLSVAGVCGIVAAAAGASVVVMSTRSALAPGQHVRRADLTPTSVRADGVIGLYLQAKDVPGGGVVITRAVAAGELVPRSAVGSGGGAEFTSVVVALTGAPASSVTAGARVDLWSADPSSWSAADGDGGGAGATGSGKFDAPAVLVPSAIVVRIVDQKPLVDVGTRTSVELLIPKSSTADVLDATANGAAMSMVPVDLPLGQ